MFWLLLDEIYYRMESAYKAGVNPTPDKELEYMASYGSAAEGDAPRIFKVVDDTAEIGIQGVLTNRPHFMASIFGGGNTTYGEIAAAVALAEQDPNVKKIVLAVNSPGGLIEGLFPVCDMLGECKKPIKAIVTGIAASAAYALAAQADEIVAVDRSVRIGSIGIRADFTVWPEDVTVTSTNAPKKAPDLTTEEGKAIIREQLDEMHALFVESIAAGRDIKPEDVDKEYGQGATFLAEEAKNRGMIDSIVGPRLKSVASASNSTQPVASSDKDPEHRAMTLEEIKAQHPVVFAAIIALGVEQGVKQERERVSAHLTLGEASGGTAIATKAIKEGTELNAALQAEYMAAGMNKQDKSNAGADDQGGTAAAADGADPQAGAESIEDQVVNAIAGNEVANAS